MNACQEVTKWITENVLMPVERFITEAREACEEINTWVEEEVWQPVESWVSSLERQCREQDCNWWCLCCNKWFCWLVVVVVKVVTWVLITVGKWVATLVCEIVTIVLGIVVELVLKVIHRLVTFVVCLFTDPGQAFKNTDGLLTNFHLPKSTLYLLVCAFAGKPLMQEAYMKAVQEKYRFFSYGDAMLIL